MSPYPPEIIHLVIQLTPSSFTLLNVSVKSQIIGTRGLSTQRKGCLFLVIDVINKGSRMSGEDELGNEEVGAPVKSFFFPFLRMTLKFFDIFFLVLSDI